MNIYWELITQFVDDSQAVSLVSALVVPPSVESTMLWYEKTIAQKASCHGYTQRDGSGVYDANKRACNYRIQQAQKITRGANSAAIRQLHKLVFPLTERNWSSDSGDNSRKKNNNNEEQILGLAPKIPIP